MDFLTWRRPFKVLTVAGLDMSLAVLATWLAFSLRLDVLHMPSGLQLWVYGLPPLLATPVFLRFGLYRAIFRYTGPAALLATAQAVAVYGALLFALLLWLRLPDVPRSVGLLQPLIFLLLVGASRAAARFWLAGLGMKGASAARGRLLIYGAGQAGVQTAAAVADTRQFALLGFVDSDPAKVGRSINGVNVVAPHQVPDLVERQGVTDILLALPNITRQRRNEIIESLRALPVHTRTVPSLADLATGRVTARDFQELDIEDLLGREPVAPDPALLAHNHAGKVVLVTGAGGSIGGELCRQIVREQPMQLVLVDHSEFGLYAIHRELQALCTERGLTVQLVPFLGSVRNYNRMFEICQTYRPHTVYHAAAYKHVPMVEHNPAEGIANNVFGTLNVAQAAMENAAERFVLVSTDKAVRPTNIMGASKRVAELVLQALAASPVPPFDGAQGAASGAAGNGTCFAMVRFGNVLDSSGSVVPLFRQQLANGGPLTVTDPEVTRYFMTIPEAAQLVLQAGAMAEGGEVFVLDMGAPVRIMDLARRMIELSGLRERSTQHPHGDIEITVMGLRPGEKLYEELLIGDDPAPTPHSRIMKAREAFVPWPELADRLRQLRTAVNDNDVQQIKDLLGHLVSGYQASSEIVDHLTLAVQANGRV